MITVSVTVIVITVVIAVMLLIQIASLQLGFEWVEYIPSHDLYWLLAVLFLQQTRRTMEVKGIWVPVGKYTHSS